jgi:hypothetical protein
MRPKRTEVRDQNPGEQRIRRPSRFFIVEEEMGS